MFSCLKSSSINLADCRSCSNVIIFVSEVDYQIVQNTVQMHNALSTQYSSHQGHLQFMHSLLVWLLRLSNSLFCLSAFAYVVICLRSLLLLPFLKYNFVFVFTFEQQNFFFCPFMGESTSS